MVSEKYEDICFENWQKKNEELKEIQKELAEMKKELEKIKKTMSMFYSVMEELRGVSAG